MTIIELIAFVGLIVVTVGAYWYHKKLDINNDFKPTVRRKYK